MEFTQCNKIAENKRWFFYNSKTDRVQTNKPFSRSWKFNSFYSLNHALFTKNNALFSFLHCYVVFLLHYTFTYTYNSISLCAVMTTVLPVLFKYCYKYCYSDSRKLWAVMKGGDLTL
jgi:hypothetical protein